MNGDFIKKKGGEALAFRPGEDPLKMEAIKDTIGKIMFSLDVKKNSASTDLEFLLKKLLTKKELRHIKINYFRRGVLNILIDSSVWLYQLSLKKEALLTDLRKSSADIKEIHFRLGEIK